jgi:hypothetical protein
LKALTSWIDKLKWEAKKPKRPYQEDANRNLNQFIRPNNSPQIMQGERRNFKDYRIVPPF